MTTPGGFQAVGPTQRRVSVTLVLDDGTVQVQDTQGWTATVRSDLRPKGTAAPRVGELWLAQRTGSRWNLVSMIGNPATPVVTGSRAASDPLARSLLAALVTLGLVEDGTTP